MKRTLISSIIWFLVMSLACTGMCEAAMFDLADTGEGTSEARSFIRETTLCFPSAETSDLTYVTRSLDAENMDILIESMLRELAGRSDYPGAPDAMPGTSNIVYELSGSTLTLDLSIDSIGNRTEEELLLNCCALANSFLGIDEIEAVNILFGGRSFSICSLPAGVFTQQIENSTLLYTDMEADRAASVQGHTSRGALLYYPSIWSGRVLPVYRDIIFDALDPTVSVLKALSEAPAERNDIPRQLPDYVSLLTKEPQITVTESGDRIIELSFDSVLNDYLALSGIDPQVFRACIVLSLTSFLPDISSVSFADTPEASQAESMVFTRSSFTNMIGGTAVLYLVNSANRLTGINYSAGRHEAETASGLLRLLLETRSAGSLRSAIPEGITASDILSVSIDGTNACVDLSAGFYTRCQSLSVQEERLIVYAMINTLCTLDTVRTVSFTVEGLTYDHFVHEICFSESLMPDPGLIDQ